MRAVRHNIDTWRDLIGLDATIVGRPARRKRGHALGVVGWQIITYRRGCKAEREEIEVEPRQNTLPAASAQALARAYADHILGSCRRQQRIGIDHAIATLTKVQRAGHAIAARVASSKE